MAEEVAFRIDSLIDKKASQSQSPLTFFLLAFALSIPFYFTHTLAWLKLLPSFPVSSFMVNAVHHLTRLPSSGTHVDPKSLFKGNGRLR